jgi:hypothetical protein
MSRTRGPDDPVTLASAIWTGLHLPPRQAVRHPLVIALVKEMHDSLANASVSDTEAYTVFLRTVALLTAYAAEEEGR